MVNDTSISYSFSPSRKRELAAALFACRTKGCASTSRSCGGGGVERLCRIDATKNGGKRKSSRILISVTVLGSAGPIRFIVREEELVVTVISTVLKSYAREGRFPVLGSDLNEFVLFSAYDEWDALSPWMPIGSSGSRNFLLLKKKSFPVQKGIGTPAVQVSKKGKGGWRAWFNKSLNSKISPH